MLASSTLMLTAPFDVPADPVLGAGLAGLTPEAVLEACRSAFLAIDAEAGTWRCARMVEALYHPGRYVRAAFVLLTDPETPAARYWPEGQLAYLQHPVRRPMSGRGQVLRLAGADFELYRFPNDRRLRSVRGVAARGDAAATWQAWLTAAKDEFRLDPASLRRVFLRYVPEQKWIIRLRARGATEATGREGKRSVALRSAAPPACRVLVARHAMLSRSNAPQFCVPAVVGDGARRGLLAVEWARGLSLQAALSEAPVAGILPRVTAAVRAFHATPVPGLVPVTTGDVCARLAAAAADLAVGGPDLARRCAAVAGEAGRRLTDAGGTSGEPVTLHHDLHADQWRLDGPSTTLLDLERVALGDPLLDVANLTMQLDMLGRRPDRGVDAATARRWGGEFLDTWRATAAEAVDADRWAAYAALSLLELARGMLRHLRPGWRALATACVDRAEAQVGRRGAAEVCP